MIVHKIFNVYVYISVMTIFVTSWWGGQMVKVLVPLEEVRVSIPCNDIDLQYYNWIVYLGLTWL
jgi:hypothetical protein